MFPHSALSLSLLVVWQLTTSAPLQASTTASANELILPRPVLEDGADGLEDPYFPKLGNGGYDVQHYTIRLAVDVVANQIAGMTIVDATALQDLTSFNLDLYGLEVSAIEVNGEPAEFLRVEHELIVQPKTPISKSANFITTVHYAGNPKPVPVAGVPVDGVGWRHEFLSLQ